MHKKNKKTLKKALQRDYAKTRKPPPPINSANKTKALCYPKFLRKTTIAFLKKVATQKMERRGLIWFKMTFIFRQITP